VLTAAVGIVIGVLVVLLITAFTGYFVAQEFAYMAVDRSRLRARADVGDRSAARALTVTRRTSFMLSGAQLGITVTGLLVGYVAEPLIGRGLGTLFGGAGIPAAVSIGIGAVIAVLISTFVQMLFGELFPKNLAIARPESLARALAASTTVYLKLFGWLIWFFDQSANILLRALHIEPVHDVEHSATQRDLQHIVAESRKIGELPAELSTLLDRILDFPTRSADHAMIPRSMADVLAADEPIGEALDRMAHGHTRYPVVAGTPEEVVGVLHLGDVLDQFDRSATVRSACRPAMVIPTTLPLPVLVRRLEAAGEEMAVVVDEYGGFAGVVTIEDIAEELVGEIADEHDSEAVPLAVREGDGWAMAGDAPLDEVERIIGKSLPQGDYETLAGLLIAMFEGLPVIGDRVEIRLTETDLLTGGVTEGTRLVADIREVEKRVPTEVFVALRSDEGTPDD
jgi:CBS domain containing-hemolysin-like protein